MADYAKGDRVVVKTMHYGPDKAQWGVRVVQPGLAEIRRAEDRAAGTVLDDAGEPKLYNDMRDYDPADDGEMPIEITRIRGARMSYASVRGVYHAPAGLIEGKTSNGNTCWFKADDVIGLVTEP